jgi:hypothetical protein
MQGSDQAETHEPTTAPSGMDVRRLAAIDMWGTAGTERRRRLIVAEFVLGATVGPTVASAILASGPGPLMAVFALWILTACLNYLPLAVHAVGFLHTPERLTAELAGVDIPAELRHYTAAQVWVFVPLALIVFDLRQRAERAGRPQ